ncbi:MAG: hypothetical protein ACOCWQ_04675 [Nanoarchaeota archaeon]
MLPPSDEFGSRDYVLGSLDDWYTARLRIRYPTIAHTFTESACRYAFLLPSDLQDRIASTLIGYFSPQNIAEKWDSVFSKQFSVIELSVQNNPYAIAQIHTDAHSQFYSNLFDVRDSLHPMSDFIQTCRGHVSDDLERVLDGQTIQRIFDYSFRGWYGFAEWWSGFCENAEHMIDSLLGDGADTDIFHLQKAILHTEKLNAYGFSKAMFN